MGIRHILGCALAALAAAAAGCGSRAAGPRPAPATQKVIVAPMAFAKAHFQEHWGGPGILGTYDVDLDGDGAAELLIASSAGTGTGGSPHLVFKKAWAGYVFLGEVFMHPRAYRVLDPTAQGNARLVVYIHSGGGEGDLIWYTNRDGKFVEDKREVIHTDDSGIGEGNRRYAEVIGR